MSKPNFASKTVWAGDNLDIMRGMNSECIDLIYLDPPFNSKADYAAPVGSAAAGAAFKDTWTLTDIDVEWINLIEQKHPALHRILLAAMTKSDKSYLAYMAARLLEMRRILKPSGSIWLHCDPTMSHYLKLVMDAIFGRKNFRNEVIWAYEKWTNAARFFQKNHDTLLFYSITGKYIFNKLYGDRTERQQRLLDAGYNLGSSGGHLIARVYDKDNPAVKEKIPLWEAEGRAVYHVKPSEGKALNDIWQISILNGQSKERTGYPTQKPLALLEQIIKACTNEGDMVLDPFCGCATTLVSADAHEREWAGIDISPKAGELVKTRLIGGKEGMLDGAQIAFLRSITLRDDIPKRMDMGELPKYNCASNKTKLYGEQSGNCAGCGVHFQDKRHFHVDHIIAQARGGSDHIDNLQLLCGSCNSIKGNRGMDYLQAKLQLSDVGRT